MGRGLTLIIGWLLASVALAAGGGRSMPFTGRLVDDLGHPITGQVDLGLNFFRTEAATDMVNSHPLKFPQVPLNDGVFRITLSFSEAELKALFPMAASVAFLQVQDLTHDRTYRKHPINQSDLTPESAPPAEGPKVDLPGSAATPAAAPVMGPMVGPPAGAAGPLPVAVAAPATVAVTAATPAHAPSILTAAAGACMAGSSIGAKFSVRSFEKGATCGAICTTAKSGSQCLRGWTLFANAQVFEFGNECGAVQITPNLPAEGHVCCCLAQAMPMPFFIDLPQTAQP